LSASSHIISTILLEFSTTREFRSLLSRIRPLGSDSWPFSPLCLRKRGKNPNSTKLQDVKTDGRKPTVWTSYSPPGPPEMEELTKKEQMEDKKSARRAPPSAGASFFQDKGCRCNSGNFPKRKIPGLVATSSSRLILLVYSDGRAKSSSLDPSI